MKKLFLTMLVAFFATVVWGQTYTTSQILAPYTGLPQCFKTYISQNYPKWTLDYAQKVATYTVTKVVTGVSKITGAKIYKDVQVTTISYEVTLVQPRITWVSGRQTTITAKMYLSSDENCKNVHTITKLTETTIS